jgi:voltage-gated potassium channel
MHLKRRILRQIPVFSSLPPEFVEAVALSLKPDIYVPGEYICRAGEEGDRMYLLIRGCLEVVKADGHLIGTLRDGDFFGEIALLKRQPRSASVRAVEYSDVYALDRAAFEVLLARYPQVAEQVREVSERRSGG